MMPKEKYTISSFVLVLVRCTNLVRTSTDTVGFCRYVRQPHQSPSILSLQRSSTLREHMNHVNQLYFLFIAIGLHLQVQSVLSWTVGSPRCSGNSRLFSCSKDVEEEFVPTNKIGLMQKLLPIQSCNPTQMSPTSLAYIGDSVFELFIRSRYVWPSRRTSDLQNLVVAKVRGGLYPI